MATISAAAHLFGKGGLHAKAEHVDQYRRLQAATPARVLQRVGAEERHLARWRAVVAARATIQPDGSKPSWNKCKVMAAEALADTPERGEPDTMWADYKRVERQRRQTGVR